MKKWSHYPLKKSIFPILSAVLIVLCLCITCLGGLAGIYYLFKNQSIPGAVTLQTTSGVADSESRFSLRSMGNPSSAIVLEEFGDYQCPPCGDFSKIIQPKIVKQYVDTGKIRFIYRNFPFLDQNNPGMESHAAALGSLCAGDQNKFWDYHDLLMRNQTGENVGDFSSAHLFAFAITLNLDATAFQSCMNSKKYNNLINLDIQEARDRGVDAVPAFFINGKKVTILNTYENDLIAALDKAIAAQ
jgi:protein-disulfide isomerase